MKCFLKRGALPPLALLVGICVVASANAAGTTRQIPAGATSSMRADSPGADQLQYPELMPDALASDAPGNFNRSRPGRGKLPKHPLDTPIVPTSVLAGGNPELSLSFNGLNHRQQRLANGGNQFSIEPPDQALCVGNGFVVEATNSVLRVFDTNGTALTAVQALNPFFGYAAAINRTTGAVGADVIDPICHYDPDNNRFVVAITTLHHVGTTNAFNGRNTIDVAVSNTGDPTGSWTIYYIPAQNDGTEGTPDHGCTLDGVTPGPCFQDYPHIGADRNGIYITTNEYDLFGPNFNASQVFALSKAQLAAHPASISVTLVENLHVDGLPGFTVWPATSPVGNYSSDRNGTEYFLSTIADVCPMAYCTARRIGLFAVTNTASLNSATPALGITSRTINSQTYVDPPKANQKPGDFPLGQCINDTTIPTVFGPGCWQLFFNPPAPAHDEVESHPDASDTRMQQTWYANGMLWGSAATGVLVNGQLKAGVAWFAVSPKINGAGKVEGQVKNQGYLALANNNLTYPAIAIGANGRGVIAFTVVGADHYPSAGYAPIDARGSAGAIHVAAEGLGPTDGFTSYKAFVRDPPRTRWGDYGAAVTDGTSIWIASEYIAQTCTLAQYLTGAIGSCGGTRTSLGNWATRISELAP
jgi:hypothetical protein